MRTIRAGKALHAALVVLLISGAPGAQAQYDRAWKIYVVPYSHTDVGYTDAVPAVIDAQNRYTDTAIAYIKRTAGNPEGERFRWTVEIPWVLESYLATRPAAQIAELMSLARSGELEIGAMHFSLQTDLCGNEELARSLSYAQDLRSRYGIPIRTAVQGDTPGFTWSLAQLLAKSEIPYFAVSMNSALADGLYPNITAPYLFRLEGQDGSRTLVWRCMDSLWAYLEGSITYQVYGSYASMEARISALLSKLVARGYPYEAVLINCATGDNGAPNLSIVDNVRQWNQAHPGARMKIATFSEFFDHVSGAYGASIPVYRGDAPNWWTWLFAPSSTGGYSRSRTAQSLLPSAEALATVASALDGSGPYPEQELRDAYVNNLSFEDHNLGAVSPSGNAPFWEYKMGWVGAAAESARSVVERSADLISANIATGAHTTLAVLNGQGWPRSEVVRIPLSDPVVAGLGPFDVRHPETGESLPAQLLSDGTVAFLAREIPAVGFRLYHLIPRSEPFGAPGALSGSVLENGFYRVQMNVSGGSAASVFDKETGRELTALNGRFKQYAKNSNQFPAGLTVASTDSGAVLQLMTITGVAPGTSAYRTEVMLPAGLKQIEFRDFYTKLAPGALESTDYFFQTGIAQAKLRYEIPFGHVRLFEDELNGFRTKHYAVAGWMNVFSEADPFAITVATDNAVVTAVPSGSFGGTLRQLVAFNDANTAYRAGVGPLTMGFAVTSDTSTFRPARALRFAHAFRGALPLRVLPPGRPGGLAGPTWSLAALATEDAVITAVKKPMRGSGIILRLYNPTPTPVATTLQVPAIVTSASVTTLLEEDRQSLPAGASSLPVTLGPFEVKTLRVSLSPVVAVPEDAGIPGEHVLYQNYPNPFNPTTVIRYDLTRASRVTLRIFNLLGQEIRRLVEEPQAAGTHAEIWDGRNDAGSPLASGIYFAVLETAGSGGEAARMVRPMTLLR